MSRSNPNEHAPNPAVRWFEWNGEKGTVRYYDKDKKENVEVVPLPFSFLLLDEVARVGGWHDDSDSGIYSNEVRDTRVEPFVVKSFKAGTLEEGLYKNIKDRLNTLGGRYVANCYIAFKNDGGELAIGSLRFKGAALGAWMEYRKAFRTSLYSKAIEIDGFSEGTKGRVTFRMPTFRPREISAEAQDIAVALDEELQAWLESYFSRRTSDQPEHAPDEQDGEVTPEAHAAHMQRQHTAPLTDDDIPF